MEVLKSLDKDILVDNSGSVWNLLRTRDTNNTVVVDIILDNAGYELFTDLCLATFLVAQKLAGKVRFYVKHYPWYVSDTMTKDFHWTVDYMNDSSNKDLQELGKLARNHLKNNVWTVEV